MADKLLQAVDVAKQFSGVYALKKACLTIRSGRVHALCGGNGAGKSTLLSIIMGFIKRDSGIITYKGRVVNYSSPAQALADGIAIITQELSPVLGLSVAENIYLSREPLRYKMLIDYKSLYKRAQDLLDSLNFPINARSLLSELTLAQIQLVEIAKAMSYNSSLLIMDEPTSAIGEGETEILFSAINNLKRQGVGIIYVSHRLTELFTIADEYTVFRDGEFISTGSMSDITRPELVELIVGQKVQHSSRRSSISASNYMLEARLFSQPPYFSNISLGVKPGEILGIYGLLGSGRSEFLSALYGLTTPTSGSLFLNSKEVFFNNPRSALNSGISLITEDRKSTGLVLCRDIKENISLSSLKLLSTLGIINGDKEIETVKHVSERFRIRLASLSMPVQQLSGGNQQKVVFSRCLMTDPQVLLCDEPTRGIDEGSKQLLYEFLRDFVSFGKCAIVVSSELDEILQISDRIIVFKQGKISGELLSSSADQKILTNLAS